MSRSVAILGVDLSGPANAAGTAWVAGRLDGRVARYVDHGLDADDAAVLAAARAARAAAGDGPLVVALDAPLSYQPGGGYRPADRGLADRLAEVGWRGVMAPTMTRMVYLTLRGMGLARMLADPAAGLDDPCIVETYPSGVLVLAGAAADEVRAARTDEAARSTLVQWLREDGFEHLPDEIASSDHLVMAAAAARAAVRWARGACAWRQAAVPPAHPFDVIC